MHILQNRAFLDPEHFVKGSYNIAFFPVVSHFYFFLTCHIFTPDAFSSIYIVYIHRYTLYKVLGARRRRLEPPIRRQWRPLAAIWKNSLLKAYIHRYTPYEVLGAHRRRLEPPLRCQWRPLAAI